jgi:molybdenum cofactor biosynthesis enzyme MoaA
MYIYKLLQLNNFITNHRIKFLGLWLLNILNKRYLSVQLDPVLACNLRCKMCYFTDEEFIKKNMKGIFNLEELNLIKNLFFKNALKLQIGCGAEPTLFKNNINLIALAKESKIPYISMVTNGNLLSKDEISGLSNAGLNEFIMSMHGVKEATYNEMMGKADFKKFLEVLNFISEEKNKNPNLKLRINYTFNEDNFMELKDFFKDFGNLKIDIIQLRPIDKLGDTTYKNFSLKKIEPFYQEIIENFKKETLKNNILFLHPNSIKRDEERSLIVESRNNSSYLMPYTYCYISPKYFWKDDFKWKEETFKEWKKRNNWNFKIFQNIFTSRKKLFETERNMLNYDIN